MNGCLSCLSQEYLTVKFCRIKASEARLSFRFVSIQLLFCLFFYSVMSPLLQKINSLPLIVIVIYLYVQLEFFSPNSMFSLHIERQL